MSLSDHTRTVGTLVRAEIIHWVAHRRSLHIVPAAFLAVAVSAAGVFTDPYLPALLAALCGVETQFNTSFARTPGERTVLSLLPLRWESVILAKNIATVVIAITAFLITAAAAAPFCHRPPGTADLLRAFLQLGTLVFPLLVVGNMRSLQDTRPDPGWQVSDLTEGFGMLVTAVAFSLPFWVAGSVWSSPLPALCIIAAGAVYWRRRSIPVAAEHIRMKRFRPWNPELLR